MECLATRPPEAERIKSFDILANVDAMQYDLALFGRVLPETREQVTNEQLTFLVEAVNRSARTPFILQRDETGDLSYFDAGRLRPYGEMMQAGKEAAESDAIIDPRREFLARWAQNDYYHYLQMRRLQPGEKYSWSSAYPLEEERKYGAKFLSDCGLQPDRKMGFLYQATCLEDGSVELESQTVDGGDLGAINTAMDLAENDPSAGLDEMVDAHDSVLEKKYNTRFYAGRKNESRNQNAWDKLLENKDLTDYLIDGLEQIANRDLSREIAEEQTKRHIYGVWALLKKRFDGEAYPIVEPDAGYRHEEAYLRAPNPRLAREVYQAFSEFAKSGKVLSGCGGSISIAKGEDDVLNASPSDVFNSIFGSKVGEDKFGSLKFDCPHCHKSNKRPRGKLIKNCQHCHKDVTC